MEIQLHSFITSVLDGVDWLTSHSSLFIVEKEQWKILRRRQGTPRGGLDVLERRKSLAPTGIRDLDSSTRRLVAILATSHIHMI